MAFRTAVVLLVLLPTLSLAEADIRESVQDGYFTRRQVRFPAMKHNQFTGSCN
jgi:hypothetical protein